MEEKINVPVEIGQTILTEISRLSEKGQGIHKEKGYIIFVNNAELNKKYKIKIIKTLPNCGFANIISEVY